ncbi:MAG: hypothetical protein PF961_06550 [Planctomycetota bacterium]|jgi:hypothetical protein|nr:hypothetical protein [Planctomycetota bacterium]
MNMRLASCALCLLVLAPLSALEADPVQVGEDLVILTNQHRISGYLLSQTSESVTIRTVGGVLRLPRRLVASAEPGFDRRLAELTADDLAGHIDLAQWCLARNRRADALAVLKQVLTHPDLDRDTLRTLARLTDEIEGPEAALPIYRAYRNTGGTDQTTLARLATLEAIDAENGALETAFQEQLRARQVAEGLESTRRWSSEDPKWANKVSTRLVEAPDSGGDRVMRLSFTGDETDRYKKAAIRWREQLDVRGSNILYLEVSNPGATQLPLSIAVKSGPNWDYFESTVQAVPNDGNWHALEFDLTDKIYKCAEDNYGAHRFSVGQPNDIREIQIQVHNGVKDGDLFVNNVGFLSK